MRTKLILALIVAILLLSAAIGVVVYMEQKPDTKPDDQIPVQSTSAYQTEPTEVTETEETVGISLPTEDPDERAPGLDFTVEGETVPEQTVDPDATHDPDEDETPRQGF